MSHKVRKRTFGHVRPEEIQISLRIRVVWSDSSLGTFWIAEDVKFLHADNIDCDQTALPLFRNLRKRTFWHVRRYVFSSYGIKEAS